MRRQAAGTTTGVHFSDDADVFFDLLDIVRAKRSARSSTKRRRRTKKKRRRRRKKDLSSSEVVRLKLRRFETGGKRRILYIQRARSDLDLR